MHYYRLKPPVGCGGDGTGRVGWGRATSNKSLAPRENEHPFLLGTDHYFFGGDGGGGGGYEKY